jgi:hypothetical protein
MLSASQKLGSKCFPSVQKNNNHESSKDKQLAIISLTDE